MAGAIEIENIGNTKGAACYSYHTVLVAVLPRYVISSLFFFPEIIRTQYSHLHDQEGNTLSNRKIIVTSESDG